MEKSMKFRPLRDHVVVRRIDEGGSTPGGIIIPDTAKDKPQEGEVVATGPGERSDDGTVYPLEVEPGDRVLFGKWSGNEVTLEGDELLFMKESDIMAVVETKAKARKAA
jgi:chaperonin GroES